MLKALSGNQAYRAALGHALELVPMDCIADRCGDSSLNKSDMLALLAIWESGPSLLYRTQCTFTLLRDEAFALHSTGTSLDGGR